jgi:hypothetical protein
MLLNRTHGRMQNRKFVILIAETHGTGGSNNYTGPRASGVPAQ